MGVDRAAVDVNLEVEMAAHGAGVSGLADRADTLAGPDPVAALEPRRADQMGVEVAALLALAVEQQVVAVEDWVVAGPQHQAGRNGNQGRAASGDDVEAFVSTAAIARSAEFADRAPRPVRPVDREDVGVERRCAIAAGNSGSSRRDERDKEDEAEEERALQWCSMTRSTMLYSFASSALMK